MHIRAIICRTQRTRQAEVKLLSNVKQQMMKHILPIELTLANSESVTLVGVPIGIKSANGK